jgi:8-oxo-dGTP pyrophosphatase MutT (NUDIX family)
MCELEFELVKRNRARSKTKSNNYKNFIINKINIPISIELNSNNMNLVSLMKKYYWDSIDIGINNNNKIKFKDFIKDILKYKNIDINVNDLINKYHNFISKIPKAGAIIINKKNEILFVKNKGFSKWCLPKGKAEFDENGNIIENNIECAIREVLEETGINIEKHINLDDKIVIKSKNLTLFLIKDFDSDNVILDFSKAIPNEIVDTKWIKIHDIPKPYISKSGKIVYMNNLFSSYVIFIINKYLSSSY